eukprot:scaffold24393_cov112-Isochrysis_galbana.AAC.5
MRCLGHRPAQHLHPIALLVEGGQRGELGISPRLTDHRPPVVALQERGEPLLLQLGQNALRFLLKQLQSLRAIHAHCLGAGAQRTMGLVQPNRLRGASPRVADAHASFDLLPMCEAHLRSIAGSENKWVRRAGQGLSPMVDAVSVSHRVSVRTAPHSACEASRLPDCEGCSGTARSEVNTSRCACVRSPDLHSAPQPAQDMLERADSQDKLNRCAILAQRELRRAPWLACPCCQETG